MIEFDQVTTRGGDRGESSLFNGERARKDDILFETLGDIDELSSHIGLARAALNREYLKEGKVNHLLVMVQKDLIRVGGQVATPERDKRYNDLNIIADKDIERLEKSERKYMRQATMPNEFILPGSCEVSARLDVARAVCRRSERRIVACIRDRHMASLYKCQNYINRLSDLLFVLGRYIEQLEN